MATTYLGLATPVTGTESGTWGDTVNNNVTGYLDEYFAKPLALSLSSTNVALTQAQARSQMIRCTGTLLANVTISQDTGVLWNGFRCIENRTSGNFSVTLNNGFGSVVIPQGRACVVFIDTTNGPRIVGIAGTSGADPVPTGSTMLFYQASAPTGWTQSLALEDYAVRLATGTGGTVGGSVAFSTAFASQTPAGSLSFSGLVSYLNWGADTGVSGSGRLLVGTSGTLPSGVASATTSQTVSVVSNTFTGTPINLAVRYANVIICVKT